MNIIDNKQIEEAANRLYNQGSIFCKIDFKKGANWAIYKILKDNRKNK